MKKIPIILFFLSFFYSLNAQITLTHNIGGIPIHTNDLTCKGEDNWAKVFNIKDFGIDLSNDKQLIIRKGQFAVSESNGKSSLFLKVYGSKKELTSADEFKLEELTSLGYSTIVDFPIVNGEPKIFTVNFNKPVIVTSKFKSVIVVVGKNDFSFGNEFPTAIISGTKDDSGTSWYKTCNEDDFIPTPELDKAIPKANLFINVTGTVFDPYDYDKILTHNPCGDLIETNIFSCKDAVIYWSRDFYLQDFDISTNEEFIIKSGKVGVNKTGYLSTITFKVYEIDDDFPASFSESKLIGKSATQEISPNIDRNSKIIEVIFEEPIVVPSNVKRILVEVQKGISYGEGIAFIAGSKESTGKSWQKGCFYGGDINKYKSTDQFGYPNANFYITVSGSTKHVGSEFKMSVKNICSEFLKEFSIEPKNNIKSVNWNFGDIDSGGANTSTDLSPFHDFSIDGTYTITATVTKKDNTIQIFKKTIEVKEPPKAYGIKNVFACENIYNTGISSSFNTSTIKEQVLGGQTEKTVLFIDESGNEYDELPNPFTNTKKDRETIKVRVSHKNIPCCYSETSFDLIVNSLPNLEDVTDLERCDINSDGFEIFDLSEIKNQIVNNNSKLKVIFYHEDGNIIQEPLNSVKNLIKYKEEITVKVIDSITNCNIQTVFKLLVNQLPKVNTVQKITACDDNNDGISKYFNTSKIQSTILGNQKGVSITYYDYLGNKLPTPLPNPYTNTVKNEEVIIARVTDIETQCYVETPIVLKTTTQPQINIPTTVYSCDMGDGYSNFDLSKKEKEIAGNQQGLNVIFLDANNEVISNLESYKNSTPWKEQISVRVENKENKSCYIETKFDVIVNELPYTEIKKSYFICDLEQYLTIQIDNNFDSYNWSFQDGEVISTTREVNLVKEGSYVLKIGKLLNGILCENSFEFNLIRSTLPQIFNIKHNEISSDNNFIEVIAVGDGDFEYSIDGENYQDSNYFNNISGGVYTVYVRDKKGCGSDSKEITIIDYPKFFTPNNDGVNDVWKIDGLKNYPNSKVEIYDRYGRLLIIFKADDSGWNGYFNGKKLPSSTYWFKVKLNNTIIFSGFFALK